MNFTRPLISAGILLNAVFASSAHALVVDFEEFSGVSGISSTFVDELDLSMSSATFRLSTTTYGNTGGISFSGGVLLEDPLGSNAVPIVGDGGSIYYGTAFSPSTSIPSLNYTNTLTIKITDDENVKAVSGSFVHGLNTNLDMMGIQLTYQVNYFVDGMLDPYFTEDITGVEFVDGADVVSFGLDTTTLFGNTFLNTLINCVEITTAGYDFTSNDNDVLEWDFLLSSVSFTEGASPVPLPAALPLFMSALLGRFVAARRKKSSDAIV